MERSRQKCIIAEKQTNSSFSWFHFLHKQVLLFDSTLCRKELILKTWEAFWFCLKSVSPHSQVCLGEKIQLCQVYDFDQDSQCFDHPAIFYQHACSFLNQIAPNYVKRIVLYLEYQSITQKGRSN